MSLDSIISDYDKWLFTNGKHLRAYEKLGAQVVDEGVHFGVWAPNASEIKVIGSFNDQNNILTYDEVSGMHSGIVKGVSEGDSYAFLLTTPQGVVQKADPFSFLFENPPSQDMKSVVHRHKYGWNDAAWMQKRKDFQGKGKPLSIYEVHAGSWQHKEFFGGEAPLNYRELADRLIPYVKEMNFTHIELLPVMEHPFGGSWGYQGVGYFAPSSRWGSPEDLMYLVDKAHQEDLGVIFDFVPGHFALDDHFLSMFDNTELFGHEHPDKKTHKGWGSKLFNYDTGGVSSFLLSSAAFWLEKYHVDGLRVDAVGEMIDPMFDGSANASAVNFLKTMNNELKSAYPDALLIAEDSRPAKGITTPVNEGGLGFDFKWSLGWMNDSLEYMRKDPLFRKHHHNKMNFSIVDLGTEDYVLPLSHDEVVHGDSSLANKMQHDRYHNGLGVDDWNKFADLRAYYGFMFAHPGKKLLFMGNEFGQSDEWDSNKGLDWNLLGEGPYHKGVQSLVKDLNELYVSEPSLHEVEGSHDGFEWLDADNSSKSAFSFSRFDKKGDSIIAISNFTPVVRKNFMVGVDEFAEYEVLLNTDDEKYGGSGVAPDLSRVSEKPLQGRDYSLSLTLPPSATIFLKPKH